jgi:hypothetical protein
MPAAPWPTATAASVAAGRTCSERSVVVLVVPYLRMCMNSASAVVAKATQEPQSPWSFTGVVPPANTLRQEHMQGASVDGKACCRPAAVVKCVYCAAAFASVHCCSCANLYTLLPDTKINDTRVHFLGVSICTYWAAVASYRSDLHSPVHAISRWHHIIEWVAALCRAPPCTKLWVVRQGGQGCRRFGHSTGTLICCWQPHCRWYCLCWYP